MTDSIRPKGARPSVPSVGATDSTAAPAPTGAPDAAHAATGVAGGQAGRVAALAEQVRSGALTAHQAVDAMVARALEQAGAQGLGAAERVHLESVLRAALATDPTLASLVRELER